MTNVPDGKSQAGDTLPLSGVALPDKVAVPGRQGVVGQVDQRWTELHGLFSELETVSAANYTSPPVISESVDNQLIQVRLGVANSLFSALQFRHAALAGHSLRVALSCSAWSLKMGLEESERDAIEVAALFHDIGVIGAPDKILYKPNKLDVDEMAIMMRTRKVAVEILRHSCTSPQVLSIIENISVWYDGSRDGVLLRGSDIPLGSRMIAVVEAFDAMTTDLVYRSARSQERAMAELYECAGVQFDPDLVRSFEELNRSDQSALHREVAGRWLHELDPRQVNSYWTLNTVPSLPGQAKIGAWFENKLLENMYDAVAFVDLACRILLWNRGAERLTGIAAAGILGHIWHPELLQMSDEKSQKICDSDCPMRVALQSGVQSLRRSRIVGRTARPVDVDTHAIPVTGNDGDTVGAILILHDASSETTLEQRCMSLYEKATRDPLTQVANRAEFDRVHEMFVEVHQQRQMPCSLIICDLDMFKRVNDTYGHQAGDEGIQSLAGLLKSYCRPGDLVARYGGEEFVMLCVDCDNAAAARRAEQIRISLSQILQSRMDYRPITASFGVTEIQPGDTPETMLRRADRALLQAKAKGRNCVVQLGAGSDADERKSDEKLHRAKPKSAEKLLEKNLVTSVPIKMAVEKIRGFVADHNASISSLNGNHLCLKIEDLHPSRFRRLTDRPATFLIDLHIEEESGKNANAPDAVHLVRTKIHVIITPSKVRNRRRNETLQRANELLASLRAYLMASQEGTPSTERVWGRVGRILIPWFHKK
jgi:diguanylate cyclase (GGDEF)-like protein/PAS domain S-box-containing protein